MKMSMMKKRFDLEGIYSQIESEFKNKDGSWDEKRFTEYVNKLDLEDSVLNTILKDKISIHDEFPDEEVSLQISPSLGNNNPYDVKRNHPYIIANSGDLICFIGQAKTGKSSILSIILSGYLKTNKGFNSIDGFEIKGNHLRKPVLYFDTEMSRKEVQNKVLKPALKRAGLKEEPDFLYLNSFKHFTSKEFDVILDYLLLEDDSKLPFPCGAIFIDGLADFIDGNINDPEAATKVSRKVSVLSEKHKCPVYVILHQNPNMNASKDHKAAGHLGSFLEKKCQSMLVATKDEENEFLVLESKHVRNSASIPPMQFKWNDELNSYSFDSVNETRKKKKFITIDNCNSTKLAKALFKFFKDNEGLEIMKEDLKEFALEFGFSETHFKNRVLKALKTDKGFIQSFRDENNKVTYRPSEALTYFVQEFS